MSEKKEPDNIISFSSEKAGHKEGNSDSGLNNETGENHSETTGSFQFDRTTEKKQPLYYTVAQEKAYGLDLATHDLLENGDLSLQKPTIELLISILTAANYLKIFDPACSELSCLRYLSQELHETLGSQNKKPSFLIPPIRRADASANCAGIIYDILVNNIPHNKRKDNPFTKDELEAISKLHEEIKELRTVLQGTIKSLDRINPHNSLEKVRLDFQSVLIMYIKLCIDTYQPPSPDSGSDSETEFDPESDPA